MLRSLQITNRTMRYGELARAIGLIEDDSSWHVRHRRQITTILCIAAAAEREAGDTGTQPLEFERINEAGNQVLVFLGPAKSSEPNRFERAVTE